MKTCPACRKKLSPAAFNDSARSADGLARMCRACTNSRRRRRDRLREPRRIDTNLTPALRQGDLATVRKLMRRGAEPHWNWICETMRSGHVALAEFLLESGAERNVFTLAALADRPGLMRWLRKKPADAPLVADMEPNSRGITPLHVACSSDWTNHPQKSEAQVRVAEVLREHGADLNARGRYGGIDHATPLFCACWTSGNRNLVRWLLNHGADPSDADLLAALGHFQRHARPQGEIAETLLEHGLPVDGDVPGDRTALQGFAHHAAHKTVAWLIDHGADVNARGPGGRTAAHLAAERNTGPATLALLVEHGADRAARDDDGRTPLDFARLNEKSRVVEWIKRQIRAGGR